MGKILKGLNNFFIRCPQIKIKIFSQKLMISRYFWYFSEKLTICGSLDIFYPYIKIYTQKWEDYSVERNAFVIEKEFFTFNYFQILQITRSRSDGPRQKKGRKIKNWIVSFQIILENILKKHKKINFLKKHDFLVKWLKK